MTSTANNQYCVCRYSDAWYAFPSSAVREVMLCPEITPLPNTSYILKGITHVNNEFLAITEPLLAGSKDETARPMNLDTTRSRRQLIVLTGSDGAWGVLVDEVAELTRLENFQPRSFVEEHLAFTGEAHHMGHQLRIVNTDDTYRAVMGEIKTNWQHGSGLDRS